ncbi:hypothetical protein [Chamaesiphon sp. OTE_20_metabat_361]|uniref:hypothetical protein n=1 Tax=Chamaesiphon sp. OTE_20_metabat_361 TaxID=2964689 RepID=UPI00286BF3F6|nr:hypothetical protein [Chamaesiphon sp. OTE_20_metabat_361]
MLTLPVMAAIVLSLVYRQVSGLSEVLRLLEQEGLMWVESMQVSKQTLSNRLREIPAQLFAQMFEQVVARSSQQVSRLVPSEWEQVGSKLAAVWLADGSNLEALVKKLQLLKEQKSPWGGRMMMMVDAWSLKPTAAWYTYITNVLDPNALSPQQVCDLYRRRWRIADALRSGFPTMEAHQAEDAFLLTKRLLGLAYLWVAGSNADALRSGFPIMEAHQAGVQIQIYATWIFDVVLLDLCEDVAVALRQPLDRISVEMVFRSLYHFSRARQFGRASEIVPFLVDNARSFGLVKAQRKRHRSIKSQSLDIWASFLS